MAAKRKPRKGKGRSQEGKKRPPTPKLGRAGEFRYLDHPADVGFVARGNTLEETFAAAAQAFSEFGWELTNVKAGERIQIRARARNLEDLLFSWLSEILFLSDAENWVFKRFKVHRVVETAPAAGLGSHAKQDVWEIQAAGVGERFDKARHRARTYIKAVTYHQLAVKRTAEGWEATVYLDV